MEYRLLIKQCLAEINPIYEFEEKEEIYGLGGLLDSLDLVRLVISLEEKLSAILQRPVSLSTNKAMSHKNSPFRTIHTLAGFIEECLLS